MHGVSKIIVINCESILGYVHKKKKKRGRYCCSQRIIEYFTHLARFTKANNYKWVVLLLYFLLFVTL